MIMPQIRPPKLKRGDSIGIISTARMVKPEEIQHALDIFKSWGLKVITGKFLFSHDNQFSGTDAERIHDIQQMIDDPEVKAIICARGGYGTTRILDSIEFSPLKTHAKWIVGFSDVTAILCALHNQNIESIHGPMPILFNKPGVESSIESLRKLLFDDTVTIKSPSHNLNRIGEAMGQVIGGNLSIIVNQIGTSSGIDPTGKILFIEDIDEYLYHVDRMMVHLKRADLLSNLRGLVVGQMTAMNDNVVPFGKNSYEIILEHVSEYDYPVCFGFPVGHEEGNLAIPCSRVGQLSVFKDGASLHFDK